MLMNVKAEQLSGISLCQKAVGFFVLFLYAAVPLNFVLNCFTRLKPNLTQNKKDHVSGTKASYTKKDCVLCKILIEKTETIGPLKPIKTSQV